MPTGREYISSGGIFVLKRGGLNFMIDEWSLLTRMAIAVACGAAIGFERNQRQKEAGMRTHIMVTLGATIIVLVSKYGFLDVAGDPGINVDVSRMASNIVTGVSFLGAGVIFLRGAFVKGLTTAAGIWTTAGIGCAIGAGMYVIGISATVMIIIIQIILHLLIPGPENTPTIDITMKMMRNSVAMESLKEKFKKENVVIMSTGITANSDGSMQVEMVVRMSKKISFEKILSILESDEQITEFSLQA
ncbi:MAG: MgtC/SapB family protein [Ruminococcus sp.]|nr:MgtC/SapB family protein [Ruminococcus sp.]